MSQTFRGLFEYKHVSIKEGEVWGLLLACLRLGLQIHHKFVYPLRAPPIDENI
jgi:hypothetical protein